MRDELLEFLIKQLRGTECSLRANPNNLTTVEAPTGEVLANIEHVEGVISDGDDDNAYIPIPAAERMLRGMESKVENIQCARLALIETPDTMILTLVPMRRPRAMRVNGTLHLVFPIHPVAFAGTPDVAEQHLTVLSAEATGLAN